MTGGFACFASGHSGFAAKGIDIVCAAVTVLMRTALQTLSDAEGIEFETNFPSGNPLRDPELKSDGKLKFKRGQLGFYAGVKQGQDEQSAACTEQKIEFLAEYLKNGFSSLSREFPRNIKFEYKLEA